MAKEKVLLGMSGGTDSLAAAIILKEQGFDVTGITFRFYENGDSTGYLDDARQASLHLGISHLIYDARDIFEQKIISYFIDEYMRGRTPVPCIVCNNELKWPLLSRVADELGIKYISTGHYSRIVKEAGKLYIQVGEDSDKDQSFFLWGLDQPLLERILFPLGNWNKVDVRKFVHDTGFVRAATKKDSMGVCFCPGDYRSFLQSYISKDDIKAGFYESLDGKIIGKHKGYPFYTVGQRRGLGMNFQTPVFVREIRPNENRIVLSTIDELYKNRMYLSGVRVRNIDDFSDEKVVICKIRYRKQATLCQVKLLLNNRAEVRFLEPLHAIAPGQATAFYCGDRVIGGGIIEVAE